MGVGFEYSFTTNWSFGAEYNHIWLGDQNDSFTVVDPRLAGILNNRIRQDVDLFTVGLNHRFGGPVVAKY